MLAHYFLQRDTSNELNFRSSQVIIKILNVIIICTLKSGVNSFADERYQWKCSIHNYRSHCVIIHFESLSFNQFFNKKFSLIEYIFFAVHSFCAEINIRNEFVGPNPCLYSLINSQEVRCVLLFQYNNDEKRVILNQ